MFSKYYLTNYINIFFIVCKKLSVFEKISVFEKKYAKSKKKGLLFISSK